VGHPSLICMDEPAAGLDSSESRVLGGHLRSIVEHGSAILLVEHDMAMVLEVCDRIYVLEFGKVIASGTPDEVRRHPAVVAAYLGRAAGEERP
jgi:branched-chain amino acid transport system ATP-binding protein